MAQYSCMAQPCKVLRNLPRQGYACLRRRSSANPQLAGIGQHHALHHRNPSRHNPHDGTQVGTRRSASSIYAATLTCPDIWRTAGTATSRSRASSIPAGSRTRRRFTILSFLVSMFISFCVSSCCDCLQVSNPQLSTLNF